MYNNLRVLKTLYEREQRSIASASHAAKHVQELIVCNRWLLGPQLSMQVLRSPWHTANFILAAASLLSSEVLAAV